VVVNPNPTISVTSATICNGQTANISASGATTYLWNTGSTSASISVNPSSTTVYTVTGTNSANCSSTKTTAVVVNPNPVPSANVNNATAPACANGSATISVSNGTSPYTYVWNPSVSTSSVATNLSGTAGSGTNYTVTITDANNCSAVFTFSVDCVTGIANLTNNSGLSIYPNPNNGQFIIESLYPVQYKIYNALGQMIEEAQTTKEKNNINISEYSKGIYTLLIIDSQNNFNRFKIIVE
jgi:hypothetical protein